MSSGKHTQPPAAMPASTLAMSGQEKSEYGVVITAREQSTDERVVLHRSGVGALAQVCRELDERDGDWRVETVSTPTTVYRDLQGTRAREWGGTDTQLPEPYMLAVIGRLDLLDPVQHRNALPRGRSHA